ncbi:ATP-dependent DNA helicase RecG [Polymorphobacter sp.]|uniref:ATP-dependent DNA helicase RecG n=1 Tax=Polymorphobacter sp. TaxID=1909290 RepID=UPI003F719606
MRPHILNPLFAEVSGLEGVGPAVLRQLARLKVARVIDLMWHLPVMAIERVFTDYLHEGLVGRPVVATLTAEIMEEGYGKRPLKVIARDAGGTRIELVWFGQTATWGKRLMPVGEAKTVAGKLDRFGPVLKISQPEVLAPGAAARLPLREPVYPLTEGLTNRRLAGLAAQALQKLPRLDEWIEPSVLARAGWPGWAEAVRAVHALEGEGPARERLAYDELLANQLALLLVRRDTRARKGRALPGTGALTDGLIARLPFSLTPAQARVSREIGDDMAQAAPMLRLLQGDVGSGKTLVALLAMLRAVESGAQAALLAPTEILARQHAATLAKLLGDLPVQIAVLTGRDKGRGRKELLAALAAGDVHILIGTHAIFQDELVYHDLGLVVVDEQHRFGVAQRLLLTRKGQQAPHLLAMTATPIPRTLELTNFGEMDASRIDELPPGRQPIETRVMAQDRFEALLEGLERHLEGGGQAYWVCPLVSESEDDESDIGEGAAAETRAAMLKGRLGAARVGLVHGRMKPADKDAVMADFASGALGLLVATTVIEVGVDVPNATLMIIEAAERFGLAQLHQLRGRVGRGTGRSVCILLRGDELTETARARLKLLRETNDGFRIAEEDLKLRGAGEILGTRQSGDAAFRIANPDSIARLLPIAHDDARLLLDRDGGLEGARGAAARTLLYLFERDAGVALLRSG